jgi:hypothetical protein
MVGTLRLTSGGPERVEVVVAEVEMVVDALLPEGEGIVELVDVAVCADVGVAHAKKHATRASRELHMVREMIKAFSPRFSPLFSVYWTGLVQNPQKYWG